jgi:hypothetical protein
MGTGLVISLYLLANLAYLAALPVQGNAALADKLKAELNDGMAAAAQLRAEAQYQEAAAARSDAQASYLNAQAALLEHDSHSAEAVLLRSAAKQAAQQAEASRTLAVAKSHEAEATVAQTQAVVEDQYARSTFALGIDHARDDRVGTAVLQQASPNFGVPAMAIAIMISTFGCINGLILMGARLYYAMAQDQLFFRAVGTLNRRRVPAAGLILQGIWSILLIFSGTYGELLDFIIFASLLFYVLTVVGLFILRRKRPDAERPYRAFGYPVVPLIYVALCAAIMLDLLIVKPVYSWPSFVIILSGIPVYFLWRWKAQPAAP